MEKKQQYPQSKDRQIAYQSSLRTILDWSNSCGKCITLKQLCGTAHILTNIVEMGYDREVHGKILEQIEKAIESENK